MATVTAAAAAAAADDDDSKVSLHIETNFGPIRFCGTSEQFLVSQSFFGSHEKGSLI